MNYQLVSIYGVTLAVSPGVSVRQVMALFPKFEKRFSRREVMEKWIPVASAAALCGVSRRQIERLIQSGQLKVAILSDPDLWPKDKKTWVLRWSLDRYIERHAIKVRVPADMRLRRRVP